MTASRILRRSITGVSQHSAASRYCWPQGQAALALRFSRHQAGAVPIPVGRRFRQRRKLDLAVTNAFDTAGPARNLAILLGNGIGSFTVGSTNPPVEFLRAGDLNRDGQMDVMGTRFPRFLYWGNGSGILSTSQMVDVGWP